MLYNIIAASAAGQRILVVIDYLALAVEVLAVCIIVFAIFYSVFRYAWHTVLHPEDEGNYRQLKVRLGRALLLGLEILVAADIVRTVALEATLQSVLVLGLLVFIRTFLSWALVVEIEERWPWQPRRENGAKLD